MSSHKDVLQAAQRRLQALFDDSPQAMYVYLDDELKFCNPKFAKLLGYRDPAQWAAIVDNIPQAFVADESVETVIRSFQATVGQGVASEVPVTWRTKDGKKVKSRTVFVPFDEGGHRMALHFIRPD